MALADDPVMASSPGDHHHAESDDHQAQVHDALDQLKRRVRIVHREIDRDDGVDDDRQQRGCRDQQERGAE